MSPSLRLEFAEDVVLRTALRFEDASATVSKKPNTGAAAYSVLRKSNEDIIVVPFAGVAASVSNAAKGV
jgi:hypothetical protein